MPHTCHGHGSTQCLLGRQFIRTRQLIDRPGLSTGCDRGPGKEWVRHGRPLAAINVSDGTADFADRAEFRTVSRRRTGNGGRSATRASTTRGAERTNEKVFFGGRCLLGGGKSLARSAVARAALAVGDELPLREPTASLPAPARLLKSSARSLVAVKGEWKLTPAHRRGLR
jgi:hypothetical protein